MTKLDSELLNYIQRFQKELDYRTIVENLAIDLIAQCRFNDAMKVLSLI